MNRNAPSADWLSAPADAQLSVDVFRDGNALVIRSPAAGVKPEDIDLSVNGDLLTIRGKREHGKEVSEDDWYYRENYWGSFSRSIILPHDVDPESAKATMRNGLLEVRLRIRDHAKRLTVKVET